MANPFELEILIRVETILEVIEGRIGLRNDWMKLDLPGSVGYTSRNI
jgi:hypothetical protein